MGGRVFLPELLAADTTPFVLVEDKFGMYGSDSIILIIMVQLIKLFI